MYTFYLIWVALAAIFAGALFWEFKRKPQHGKGHHHGQKQPRQPKEKKPKVENKVEKKPQEKKTQPQPPKATPKKVDNKKKQPAKPETPKVIADAAETSLDEELLAMWTGSQTEKSVARPKESKAPKAPKTPKKETTSEDASATTTSAHASEKDAEIKELQKLLSQLNKSLRIILNAKERLKRRNREQKDLIAKQRKQTAYVEQAYLDKISKLEEELHAVKTNRPVAVSSDALKNLNYMKNVEVLLQQQLDTRRIVIEEVKKELSAKEEKINSLKNILSSKEEFSPTERNELIKNIQALRASNEALAQRNKSLAGQVKSQAGKHHKAGGVSADEVARLKTKLEQAESQKKHLQTLVERSKNEASFRKEASTAIEYYTNRVEDSDKETKKITAQIEKEKTKQANAAKFADENAKLQKELEEKTAEENDAKARFEQLQQEAEELDRQLAEKKQAEDAKAEAEAAAQTQPPATESTNAAATEEQQQTNQEEPKQEEPKQEEPKQEEPKQEEPKQEEPKQEEPKQDQPDQTPTVETTNE